MTPAKETSDLSGLVADVADLLRGAVGPYAAQVEDSVVRPLASLTEGTPPEGGSEPHEDDRDWGELLWSVTLEATRLRARPDAHPLLVEATAALQHMALGRGGADDLPSKEERAELLRQMMADVDGVVIQVAEDGPYLVTDKVDLRDWLGDAVERAPQMALCRCGHSSSKPLCDGSHAAAAFSGAKDPNRVPDRGNAYEGQQVTVLDNRGICQHSGFCTDRVPTVFHSGSEPFVTPSGGRLDEIVRSARACPSGALSFAIDGTESRPQVDQDRPAAVVVSKDGPYRVTGSPALVDDTGADVPRAQGASREHFALCRCGRSQNKPFCSGMHWYVDFHDPVPDDASAPSIYEWAGGHTALLRMTEIFYQKHVPADPLLGPVFASMSPDHPVRVATWLGEVFGGPKDYSAHHGGYPHMLREHRDRGLTEEQRLRWVGLLGESAAEAGLPNDPEFQAAFHAYLEWGSRLAVANSQPGSAPPEHMPMPHWDWTTSAGPPGSRPAVGANSAAKPEAPAWVAPGPDEQVSFAKHVRQLFREMDRRSMSFAFDLWAYEDVKAHADAILGRLEAGTMPCDGAWPSENVDTFRRWARGGTTA